MDLCFYYRLLQRLNEALKQHQDLKKDNKQKDQRINTLLEENGTLASEVGMDCPLLVFLRVTRGHKMSQECLYMLTINM